MDVANASCCIFTPFKVLLHFITFLLLCTWSFQDAEDNVKVLNLVDPSSPGKVVGKISLSCSTEVYDGN